VPGDTSAGHALPAAPARLLRAPQDNLRPLSCVGENWQGGLALTLVDSLDTLALLNRCGGGGCWVGWRACALLRALLAPARPTTCPHVGATLNRCRLDHTARP
jgi:hypothetical protein